MFGISFQSCFLLSPFISQDGNNVIASFAVRTASQNSDLYIHGSIYPRDMYCVHITTIVVYYILDSSGFSFPCCLFCISIRSGDYDSLTATPSMELGDDNM